MKKPFIGLGTKIKFAFKRNKNSSSQENSGSLEIKNTKSYKKISPLQAIKMTVYGLIIFMFCFESIFAVAIYGFKTKDSVTSAVAKIIPYPAVFTASGIVTVSNYWNEKNYIEHFYASTQQASMDSAELSKQILQQEAENQIIKKEAITFKIGVTKKDVDDSMQQIFDNNGGQAEVEKALKDLYGLSVDQFKSLVETQLLRDKISKDVIKHVTVRHILIRLEENASQEQIDAAKTKTESILNEIKNGLSFEDAAKKYSEDVGSNQDGGLLAAFARGDMVKEFEDVAFSTKAGDMSEPFRTSFGWHVLKVESNSGYVDQSFDNWISTLMKQNYVFYLFGDK